MQHLDEGTIHAWLDGALPPDEGARVEAHVGECERCAAAVAEARGLIAGASRILTALDDVPGDVIPGRATPALPPVAPAAARRWRPRLTSGAMRAAAVIAFLAAGGVAVSRVANEAPREPALASSETISDTERADVAMTAQTSPAGGAADASAGGAGAARAAEPDAARSATPAVPPPPRPAARPAPRGDESVTERRVAKGSRSERATLAFGATPDARTAGTAAADSAAADSAATDEGGARAVGAAARERATAVLADTAAPPATASALAARPPAADTSAGAEGAEAPAAYMKREGGAPVPGTEARGSTRDHARSLRSATAGGAPAPSSPAAGPRRDVLRALAGCYTLSLAPWEPAPDADEDAPPVTPPSRVVLDTAPAAPSAGSGYRILPAPGEPRSAPPIATWTPIPSRRPSAPDSIRVTLSDGHRGVDMRLGRDGDGFRGTATTVHDFPRETQRAAVRMARDRCPRE
jgi:hypothetical protein